MLASECDPTTPTALDLFTANIISNTGVPWLSILSVYRASKRIRDKASHVINLGMGSLAIHHNTFASRYLLLDSAKDVVVDDREKRVLGARTPAYDSSNVGLRDVILDKNSCP